MIDPKELRIGNLVQSEGGNEIEVESISQDGINIQYGGEDLYHISQIHPIPLTEEWLVRFGFEKCETSTHYLYRIHDIYYVRFLGLELFYFEMHDKILHTLKYVHQLQNLYFALTGQELQITQQ